MYAIRSYYEVVDFVYGETTCDAKKKTWELLDDTIRRIRGLSMDHLLPTCMRLALQVATLTGDPTDAAMALSGLEESPATVV